MDQLCSTLLEARPLVAWYSIDKAILLERKISGVCGAYRKSPKDKDCCERLVKLAEVVKLFLLERQTGYELADRIDKLLMEVS